LKKNKTPKSRDIVEITNELKKSSRIASKVCFSFLKKAEKSILVEQYH
jgi:hypothetical protein